MKAMSKLACAFTAGNIGALILFLCENTLNHFHGNAATLKAELYRIMVWGGIWALLLALPILRHRWMWRAIAISAAVVIFNFIILFPKAGYGVFGVDGPNSAIWGNIIYNTIWGFVAAFFYHLTQSKD